MAEYTYKDIIIDPNSEEAKNAVGKICYFSNSPRNILSDIYCNSAVEGILTNMDDGYFEVDNEGYWDCIILKKEEPKPKPKYVPFKNITEFLDAYRNAPGCLNEESYFLSNHGMWLKDKDRKGAYFMVTEIWNEGVVVSDIKMKTTKEGNNEYYTTNENTEWKELLRDYTFLDGSPCGKLAEEDK